MKDLTNSTVARQNILNNNYAIEEVQNAVGIEGIMFDHQLRFLKSQIASFFEIDERTIERYLNVHEKELKVNGYEVLKGKQLKEFILAIQESGASDMYVAHKTRNLGLFNFRAFLNLGMLLKESENFTYSQTRFLSKPKHHNFCVGFLKTLPIYYCSLQSKILNRTYSFY
ncbi:MAG: hypothetical protein GX277_03510 [Bacteroidales bacterium]|nr:hypothetical protein [Bacteroidales bacterium]